MKLNIGNWLNFAVARDNTELLQLFLSKGATPNQIGAALHEAAAHGARKCAPLLIEHAPRAYVNSALWQAAFVEEWRGSAIQYPDIVRLLLRRKPDKRALDVALLRVAGFDDQGIVVPLLLEAGADPNASDEQGETALIHALKDYDPNSVRNLLKAGADPNAKSARGTPALVMALGTPFGFGRIAEVFSRPRRAHQSGRDGFGCRAQHAGSSHQKSRSKRESQLQRRPGLSQLIPRNRRSFRIIDSTLAGKL